MPRPFSHSTAEQVVQIVDAIHVKRSADSAFLETFCDFSPEQVKNGIGLAIDLDLITQQGTSYSSNNALTRFFSTPNDSEKAAVLRVVLETYEPFFTFRERLTATASADTAAQQTKAILDLEGHREEIKDTLISLGTYTGAITVRGGGRYSSSRKALANQLETLANACEELSAAEDRIRIQIGDKVSQVDRDEVLIPLARALIKASNGEPSDAVGDAAEAIESFLARLATRLGVSLARRNGIIQKLDKFRTGGHLPRKVVEAGKYLGQLRNAADHGVDTDPEVGAVWEIQENSGLQYVFVACSFIAACLEREAGGAFII